MVRKALDKKTLQVVRNMVAMNNHLGKVGFDDTIDASYTVLNEGLSNEQFIEIHRRLMRMYEHMEHCTGKHLLDSSKVNSISQTAQDWACGIVLPELVKASPTRKLTIAIILHEDIYKETVFSSLSQKLGSQTIVGFFKDEDSAKVWLKEQ